MKKKSASSRSLDGGYSHLIGDLTELLEVARCTIVRSVNVVLTATYWKMGQRIVQYEQQGHKRAEYGKKLLERLANDLTERFGRGFGYSNLNLIRQFYLTYQDRQPILQ